MKNPAAIYLTVLLFVIDLCASPSVFAQARDAQSKPPPSTAEIIRALQSHNPAEREQAEKAAIAIKPLPTPLVPALLNACKGLSIENGVDLNAPPGSEPPKCNTGYVVQALQNAGTQVLPQLLVALDDNDASVRQLAADTLLGLAHDSAAAWPAVITAMANTHYEIPPRIAGFLPDKIGAPIAPLLVRSLSHSKPRIRGGSAMALSWLLERYGNPNAPDDYVEQPSALNKYGLTLSGAVMDIAKVLNSLEPDQLAQVIQGLAGIGPPAKGAIPYVLPMLKDHNPSVRWSAVYFFGAMGQAGKVAMPDIIRSLKDPDKGVRLRAMAFLGGFGPAAKDALPDLAIALKSTDTDTIEQASLALASIDPSQEGILPGVMLTLNDPNHPEDRDNAFKALNKLGSRAKPAAPALVRLIATDLDSENSDDKAADRHAAVTALALADGADAIPELQHVISTDKDDEVRIAAVTALGGLGSSSPRAISALADALNNDSEAVRDAASEALGKLGRPSVPAVIAALKSTHLYQRAWAVQALGRIKPMRTNAEHALRLALNDRSEIVRTAAQAALKGNEVNVSAIIKDKQLDEDFDIDEPAITDHGDGQGLDSFVAGTASTDARIYSKAEIVAPIPPNENHQYPTELKYSVPIARTRNSTTNAEFLATVHAATEGVDRLAVWKKIGDDKYQRLLLQETSSENHFEKPEVFSSKVLVTGQGKDHYETALFLNLPLHRVWGDGDGIDDNVFVLDHDHLRPVAIADAEMDSKQMHQDETVWNGGSGNEFKDNDLEFVFRLWKSDACHACAEPFEVQGTYRVVEVMRYDAQKKDWVANWKMLVDTAQRVRDPEN